MNTPNTLPCHTCQYAGYCREKPYVPEQIDEAEWDRALNVLPPMKWSKASGFESFTISERCCDDFYTRYVRQVDRYWKVTAPVSASISSLGQLCQAHAESQASSQAEEHR